MSAFSENGPVTMTVAEVDMLRRVFEAICAEYQVPREGIRAEHLARFLMCKFRGSVSTERSLLAAARKTYPKQVTRRPRAKGG